MSDPITELEMLEPRSRFVVELRHAGWLPEDVTDSVEVSGNLDLAGRGLEGLNGTI